MARIERGIAIIQRGIARIERATPIPERGMSRIEQEISLRERAIAIPERVTSIAERGISRIERAMPIPVRVIARIQRRITLAERGIAIPGRMIAIPEQGIAIAEGVIAIPERALSIRERAISITERAIAIPERVITILERGITIAGRAITILERGIGIPRSPLAIQERFLSIRCSLPPRRRSLLEEGRAPRPRRASVLAGVARPSASVRPVFVRPSWPSSRAARASHCGLSRKSYEREGFPRLRERRGTPSKRRRRGGRARRRRWPRKERRCGRCRRRRRPRTVIADGCPFPVVVPWRPGSPMGFKIEAFQNKFLAPGSGRVDAIVTVTADADAGSGGQGGGGPLVVGFIVDKSGSMAGERIESAKRAVTTALHVLPPSAWFFVVAFDSDSVVVVPESQATPENLASAAVSLSRLVAGGGTAMSTGLAAARHVFERAPSSIKQGIFLTDGKNESESAGNVVAELHACEGMFQCDCWGVGTDWRVGEVQQIAQGLLGKASIIPDPSGLEAVFRAAIEKASGKALRDVRLRLWTPQGANIAFVKQANPTLEDLTGKARAVSPQVREYMTGAWGANESRDFHVAIEVKAGNVGEEMLAARPSVVWLASSAGGWAEKEEKPAEARVFAAWTADDSLSSRIDKHVAHYTGQGQLAEAIQQGLDARAQGNDATATQLLGKAVKIAHESGNVEMTQRLAKVVDVVEVATGTVRLKRDVSKVAAMDLELESRTTKRMKGKTTAGNP